MCLGGGVGKILPGVLNPVKAASPLGAASSLLSDNAQKTIDPIGSKVQKIVASQDGKTQAALLGPAAALSGGAKKTLLGS